MFYRGNEIQNKIELEDENEDKPQWNTKIAEHIQHKKSKMVKYYDEYIMVYAKKERWLIFFPGRIQMYWQLEKEDSDSENVVAIVQNEIVSDSNFSDFSRKPEMLCTQSDVAWTECTFHMYGHRHIVEKQKRDRSSC